MAGTPDPIGRELRDVPPELEAVLVKCLGRYPDERYLSVADLAAALIPFARKISLASAEAAIRIAQGSSLAHGSLPPVTDSLPPPGFDYATGSAGVAIDKTVSSGPPLSLADEYASSSSSRSAREQAAPRGCRQAAPPADQRG